MLLISLNRLRRHLAASHARHIYAVKGVDAGLKRFRELVERSKYADRGWNNQYLKLCLRHARLDLTDAFVAGFHASGLNQELGSIIGIYQYLYKIGDQERISRYARILPQLGKIATAIDELDLIHQTERLGPQEILHLFERYDPAELSDLARQVYIAAHIATQRFSIAGSLLRSTLFANTTNDRVIKLRHENATRLRTAGPPDLFIEAFLDAANVAEGYRQHTRRRPLPDPSTRSWIATAMGEFFLEERLIGGHRLAQKSAHRSLSRYWKLLERCDFEDHALIDRFILMCLKQNALDHLDDLVQRLATRKGSPQYDLTHYPELLRITLKSNDLARLAHYERLLPYLPESLTRRYRLQKLAAAGEHEALLESAGDLSRISSADEIALVVDALIKTNRYREAGHLVRRGVFAPETSASDLFQKASYAIEYARTLRRADPLLDAFFEARFYAPTARSNSIKDFHKLLFTLNTYYLASKNSKASRNLLSELDLENIPAEHVRTLSRWLMHHWPHSSVTKFLESLHQQQSEPERDGQIIYALSANLFEVGLLREANTLLVALHDRDVAANLLLAKTEAALGNVPRAVTLLSDMIARNCNNESIWSQLLALGDHRACVDVFHRFRAQMTDHTRLRLTCRLASQGGSEDVALNWPAAIAMVEGNYFFGTALALLNAAFALEEHEHFERIIDIIASRLTTSTEFDLEPQIAPLLTLLYKRGMQTRAFELLQSLELPERTDNLEMLVLLSQGRIIDALDVRTKMMAQKIDAYIAKEFPRRSTSTMMLACPEKDLAGELYNSYFYRTEITRRESFTVACDFRLAGIYRRNFPELNVVAKLPSRLWEQHPERFAGLPRNLRNYFDAPALAAVKEHRLFPIAMAEDYDLAVNSGHRSHGWLSPDAASVGRCLDSLQQYSGRRIVGFSPASTFRSPLRDLHFVDRRLWGPIFALPNTVFVNLNSALDSHQSSEMAEQYKIDIHQPTFDLHNDFESLLALMSCLDCAILPANSLMDFAASVGLRTFVFSPSGIMKNWLAPGTDSYVFSDRVEFIHAGAGDSKLKLVEAMADRVYSVAPTLTNERCG